MVREKYLFFLYCNHFIFTIRCLILSACVLGSRIWFTSQYRQEKLGFTHRAEGVKKLNERQTS